VSAHGDRAASILDGLLWSLDQPQGSICLAAPDLCASSPIGAEDSLFGTYTFHPCDVDLARGSHCKYKGEPRLLASFLVLSQALSIQTFAMAENKTQQPTAAELRENLMHASHILHRHNILDGFGHISVRNPENPNTFFLTGQAAGLISSPDIFVEYQVEDGRALTKGAPTSPYSEHYIHAAILAQFPEVQSVVHSHAREILSFGVTTGSDRNSSSGLRPVIHTAAFLGHHVPVWDISDVYTDDHTLQKSYMLVNDYHLGASLAAAAKDPSGRQPYRKAVLQRGHGFVALGDSIAEAVYNAIYTVENARVQAQAEQRSNSHGQHPIHFLSPEEIDVCAPMDKDCIFKVWPLWMAEVTKNPIWS
jgi:ribulose-5-phosphate 4-epimerase/fuculose-1-phosphate aldolase